MTCRRLLGFMRAAIFTMLSLLALPMGAQPSTPPPAQEKTPPAKTEDPSAAQKPAVVPPEAPALDPDVKQWFLEKNHLPRPAYDPKDVEVLTGKTREAERLSEYRNYGNGYWPPFDYSYGSPGIGGNSSHSSRFASPGFFVFGHRHGFGNGFFFGRPFFHPFHGPGGRRR